MRKSVARQLLSICLLFNNYSGFKNSNKYNLQKNFKSKQVVKRQNFLSSDCQTRIGKDRFSESLGLLSRSVGKRKGLYSILWNVVENGWKRRKVVHRRCQRLSRRPEKQCDRIWPNFKDWGTIQRKDEKEKVLWHSLSSLDNMTIINPSKINYRHKNSTKIHCLCLLLYFSQQQNSSLLTWNC
jgi:hypothetical protein